VIVDNMLNLELPFIVSELTGNTTLRDMSVSHANRMISDIFQPAQPGCVWHLVTYNDSDGTILNRSSTPQGLGLNTVWSRGQGWATYGFIMAHRYTADARYLATARSAAECFIALTSACCSDDFVPWWDFYAGPPLGPAGPTARKDTSAAMIASSGMIELAWASPPADRARYLAYVQTTLAAVTASYLYTPAESEAVLRNGTSRWVGGCGEGEHGRWRVCVCCAAAPRVPVPTPACPAATPRFLAFRSFTGTTISSKHP